MSWFPVRLSARFSARFSGSRFSRAVKIAHESPALESFS